MSQKVAKGSRSGLFESQSMLRPPTANKERSYYPSHREKVISNLPHLSAWPRPCSTQTA